MKLSRREMLAVGAALPAVGLLGGVAFGADVPVGVPVGAVTTVKDPLLAACLLLGGKKQIEVSNFAAKRATSEDVKAFAVAEVKEHEHIKEELGKLGFAPPAYPAIPTTPAGTPAPAIAVPRMLSVGKFPLPPGASDLIQVDMEVGEQCIATITKELEALKGTKFDKCYVAQQLHEHYGLLDRAVVFKKHSSKEMQALLDEGRGVIEKHIATLKALGEKLEMAKPA